MEEVYRKLMRKMDDFPAGAPPSENLLEILKLVFNPEEAELALDLSLSPEPLPSLADKTGREEGELAEMLEGMADKGLVYCKEKEGVRYYNLLPLVPGIFEMQFMKGEKNPTKRRIAELFDLYYHEGWGEKAFTSRTALARVLMVEEQIPAGGEILPYEKVSEYIKDSTYMALTTCFCRHQAELLERSCGAPKDVCMCFGPFAEFLVERGFARRASRAEMLDALNRAEKAGLVHVSDNIQEKINFICNCCGCCCGFLGTITKLNLPGAVAASRYLARADGDRCDGCGVCVDVCQVKAVTLEEEAAAVDAGRCIGCGLCVSNCPAGAMEVILREDWKPPARDLAELGVAVLKERGKL
jgi:ferredoxin